jgi:hypothetical protein
MNYAQYISLAIVLVEDVLSQFKGTATEATIVADVQAALDALLKVQGTPVTYAQLEALRVNKTF